MKRLTLILIVLFSFTIDTKAKISSGSMNSASTLTNHSKKHEKTKKRLIKRSAKLKQKSTSDCAILSVLTLILLTGIFTLVSWICLPFGAALIVLGSSIVFISLLLLLLVHLLNNYSCDVQLWTPM